MLERLLSELNHAKRHVALQWPIVKRAYSVHLIFIASLCTALLSESQRDRLAFNRHLMHEHWWSILTAHVTHLNWTHWLMNMSGLLALVWLAPLNLVNLRFFAVILGWMLFITTGFVYLQLDYLYFGFSGVLYGWICVVLICNKEFDLIGRLLVVGLLVGKVGLDALNVSDLRLSENLLGSEISSESHLLGLAYGLLVLILLGFVKVVKKPTT